jgi:crossover junction endodeoxyribonuclease RuvC
MYVIGIDPGASGAVAILKVDGSLVEVWDMPSVQVFSGKTMKNRVSPEMLAAELRNWDQAVAYVEQVGAMPGQGVSSMFAFGESLGIVRGVLAGLGISCHMVPPARWKKAMGVNAGKDGSRAKAAQLWPHQAGEFKRVKDDGRAEAALIGRWGIHNSA